MTSPPIARRTLVSVAMAAATLLSARSALAGPRREATPAPARPAASGGPDLVADLPGDQSTAFQRAVDDAAIKGVPLTLAPGRYRVQRIRLHPDTILIGQGRRTRLIHSGTTGPLLVADGAHGLRLERLTLDGETFSASGDDVRSGLVAIRASRDIALDDVTLHDSPANGLVLEACSGRIVRSTISHVAAAAILSLDATGLEIADNTITDCANNGILVWRSKAGEDATRVHGNRIERIHAAAGGSGQNGNGINVFRAGGVLVTGNHISNCAYSAIRANAASNIQMVANSCARIGEVALYAEFGFEGALISSNIVDTAASGISVTNFNEGGRLAVIQGNLIRNLKRRTHEPVDKRGEGISVEADAAVTGNTIEGAETAGIVVGWGRYMRDIAVTSNVIRRSPVGIMVTRDPAAGAALIAQNLISGATGGAIRMMDNGTVTGPDLARTPPPPGRLTITANSAAEDRA